MDFFRFEGEIPFTRWGKLTMTLSLIITIFSIYFLATKGLNLAVDFTGGTVMEVSYEQPADLNKTREILAGIGMSDAVVQNFGTSRDVMIRLPVKLESADSNLSEIVMAALRASDPTVKMQRVEFVGPQVGDELLEDGILALLFVAIAIIIYLAIRFEWKFGVACLTANLHDVLTILGCFALFQWEFDLTVLAAVLAILGYSVNESVVISDRIRENFRKMRRASVTTIIDNAITETMSRTIITHGSTQMVVVSMLLFGGEILHNFALALTIGILFGIYSSNMIATPVMMLLKVKREDLVRPVRKQQDEAVP